MQNFAGRFFIFLICVFSILGFSSGLKAQMQFGLVWESSDPNKLIQSLDAIESAGIEMLVLPLSSTQFLLAEASARNFQIFIKLPNRWNLSPLDANLPERLILLLEQEQISAAIAGIVIAEHPNLHSAGVAESVNRLANEVQNQTELEPFIITHISVDLGFSYFLQYHAGNDDISQSYAIIENPDSFFPRTVYSFLAGISSNTDTVFFTGEEFINGIETYPQVSEVLMGFKQSSEPIVSLPAPRPQESVLNLPAIFLTGILIILLLSLKLFHVYFGSLPRYFFGHSFFIVDVFERHYRFGLGSWMVFLIIAVIYGMSWLVIFDYSLSEGNRQFLIYHLPFLTSGWNIFLSGFIPIFLLNMFFISWLASVALRPEAFAQSGTLVLWPQHVSILIFVVFMLLAANNTGIQVLPYLFLIMLFVPFISFLIASIDFATRPTFSVPIHLLLTVVLLAILLYSVYWLMTNLWNASDFLSMMRYLQG